MQQVIGCADVQGDLQFEQLVTQMSGMALHIDLEGKHLKPQRHSNLASSFLVWRSAPSGCTVQSGTIALPSHGLMLLSGYGAHFKDVTFTGAPQAAQHQSW